MKTIDITEHKLDLAELENILIHQKLKPLSIRYCNKGETFNVLGYLSLNFKIHRYDFTLFTSEYDYEEFYSIIDESRNLSRFEAIIKGAVE